MQAKQELLEYRGKLAACEAQAQRQALEWQGKFGACEAQANRDRRTVEAELSRVQSYVRGQNSKLESLEVELSRARQGDESETAVAKQLKTKLSTCEHHAHRQALELRGRMVECEVSLQGKVSASEAFAERERSIFETELARVRQVDEVEMVRAKRAAEEACRQGWALQRCVDSGAAKAREDINAAKAEIMQLSHEREGQLQQQRQAFSSRLEEERRRWAREHSLEMERGRHNCENLEMRIEELERELSGLRRANTRMQELEHELSYGRGATGLPEAKLRSMEPFAGEQSHNSLFQLPSPPSPVSPDAARDRIDMLAAQLRGWQSEARELELAQRRAGERVLTVEKTADDALRRAENRWRLEELSEVRASKRDVATVGSELQSETVAARKLRTEAAASAQRVEAVERVASSWEEEARRLSAGRREMHDWVPANAASEWNGAASLMQGNRTHGSSLMKGIQLIGASNGLSPSAELSASWMPLEVSDAARRAGGVGGESSMAMNGPRSTETSPKHFSLEPLRFDSDISSTQGALPEAIRDELKQLRAQSQDQQPEAIQNGHAAEVSLIGQKTLPAAGGTPKAWDLALPDIDVRKEPEMSSLQIQLQSRSMAGPLPFAASQDIRILRTGGQGPLGNGLGVDPEAQPSVVEAMRDELQELRTELGKLRSVGTQVAKHDQVAVGALSSLSLDGNGGVARPKIKGTPVSISYAAEQTSTSSSSSNSPSDDQRLQQAALVHAEQRNDGLRRHSMYLEEQLECRAQAQEDWAAHQATLENERVEVAYFRRQSLLQQDELKAFTQRQEHQQEELDAATRQREATFREAENHSSALREKNLLIEIQIRKAEEERMQSIELAELAQEDQAALQLAENNGEAWRRRGMILEEQLQQTTLERDRMMETTNELRADARKMALAAATPPPTPPRVNDGTAMALFQNSPGAVLSAGKRRSFGVTATSLAAASFASSPPTADFSRMGTLPSFTEAAGWPSTPASLREASSLAARGVISATGEPNARELLGGAL